MSVRALVARRIRSCTNYLCLTVTLRHVTDGHEVRSGYAPRCRLLALPAILVTSTSALPSHANGSPSHCSGQRLVQSGAVTTPMDGLDTGGATGTGATPGLRPEQAAPACGGFRI
jgi:hypothetical protein